jgi:hypothetical protein
MLLLANGIVPTGAAGFGGRGALLYMTAYDNHILHDTFCMYEHLSYSFKLV